MQFNFDLYKPSDIECWINSKYQKYGIWEPNDLTIENVSELFEISVSMYEGPVFAEWIDGVYAFVFLNKHKSPEEQKNDFFHELCHPLRHVGHQDQLHYLFEELQEFQAAQFQLAAAMPIYLVSQVPTQLYWERYIDDLSHVFEQPSKFVQKRIYQIINNINSNMYWENVNTSTI